MFANNSKFIIGRVGGKSIVAGAEAAEVQPFWVTINEYVPAASGEKVAVVPEPLVVVPPGFVVIIQLPLEGIPLSAILPVAVEQVA